MTSVTPTKGKREVEQELSVHTSITLKHICKHAVDFFPRCYLNGNKKQCRKVLNRMNISIKIPVNVHYNLHWSLFWVLQNMNHRASVKNTCLYITLTDSDWLLFWLQQCKLLSVVR